MLSIWKTRFLEDQDGVRDLLRKAAERCHSVGRYEDVYVVFEGRILRNDLSLAEQGVGEGNVARINLRLRGGAPKSPRKTRETTSVLRLH